MKLGASGMQRFNTESKHAYTFPSTYLSSFLTAAFPKILAALFDPSARRALPPRGAARRG